MYHKRAERFKISFCFGWCLGLAFLLGSCRRERNRALRACDDLTLLVKTIDLMAPEDLKLLRREAIEPSRGFSRRGWLFADSVFAALFYNLVSSLPELLRIFLENVPPTFISEEFLSPKLGVLVANAKPRVITVILSPNFFHFFSLFLNFFWGQLFFLEGDFFLLLFTDKDFFVTELNLGVLTDVLVIWVVFHVWIRQENSF